MHCTWTTGPDTGRTATLAVGRHLVGRAATAAIRCDDPAIEPHHVVVDVGADGTVTATQLTGRVPVRTADGAPLAAHTRLVDGATLMVGASTLSFHAAPTCPTAPAVVRPDGTIVRAPRVVPQWSPADLTSPTPPDGDDGHGVGGLVPALLGLVGAAAVALLLHQPTFLLFGALGSVVALGSWGAQRVAARRARRRRRAEHDAAVVAFHDAERADRESFVRAHLATVPTTERALTAAASRSVDLWSRRGEQADAWRVSLGIGAVQWRPASNDVVPEMPVATDLGPGMRLAVVGPGSDAGARAVLAQLVAQCGPADLRVVVVTAQPERWRALHPLPHVQLPDGTISIGDDDRLPEMLEMLDSDERAHVVLVTDRAESLATRTSPLRRVLAHRDAAVLAVLAEGDGVPHLCTAVLTTTHGPLARWVADTDATLLPETIRMAGLGESAMARHCAALAAYRDPEDVLGATRLPRHVDLAPLVAPHGWCADDVLERWATRPTALRTPIGVAGDGIVDIDMDRDGPHALLAGTTGAGKSELLRSLVMGFALAAPPSALQMVLVDYKGGATFDALTALPHVAGVVTDLDDALADRALRSLHAELRRREAFLREHGAGDLASLRRCAPQATMPRLVVVVDEFAALVAEQPDFLHALVGVAQRGRSLGVHLVLATQRPQGVISDDIRANTNLRIALRLHDTADAVDVVGDPAPATLPRGVPGRGVMRLGADEHLVFQTAHLAHPHDAVAAVCAAAARQAADDGIGAGCAWPPPWVPPLPTHWMPDEVPDGVLGWCDDPDQQRRVPLQWSPSDGSLVVAGSLGSGVTSTLRTLAAHALRDPQVHVHVLTAEPVGDDAPTFPSHPRLVQVGLHEGERVHRLLHRLRMPDLDGARRVVIIDGVDTVRRTLDSPDTVEAFDALDDMLAAAHDTVVVGTTRPASLPISLLARCPHRWVLHLHDAVDAGVLGVGPRQVPGPVPGRLHVAATGRAAQLVTPTGDAPNAPTGRPVAPIEVVPALVHAHHLPKGAHETGPAGGEVLLPLGLNVADGRPHTLVVPDGEHVLVLGGSRSGRSSVLTRVARAWRAAHPAGRVLAVLPRRSSFDTSAADAIVPVADLVGLGERVGRAAAVLVVCDDAELVDDADGTLAALAAGRRDGFTIVAAARPDALRQRYGHWTTHVRHSRTGLVAAGGGDGDGDLLGTVLPRRLPLRPRPGLMWVTDLQGSHLVQVAADAVEPQPQLARRQ